MMNIYLFIIIFFAGIMEFNKFFKCEKKLEKRCTLIIAISYFCELIFFNFVKSEPISTVGCCLSGISLLSSLVIRYINNRQEIGG